MALELTAAAERDLDNIYVDGALHFGTHQAEQYSDNLYDCLNLLASQPFMARERTELERPVRVHSHGSHLIIYQIEGRDVLILRILHRRCDWERML